jgi:hypothetical protein
MSRFKHLDNRALIRHLRAFSNDSSITTLCDRMELLEINANKPPVTVEVEKLVTVEVEVEKLVPQDMTGIVKELKLAIKENCTECKSEVKRIIKNLEAI